MKKILIFLILISLINFSFSSDTELTYESEFTINAKIVEGTYKGDSDHELWFFIVDDYKNFYIPYKNKLKTMLGNKYKSGTRGKFTLKKIKVSFWFQFYLSAGTLVEVVKFEPEQKPGFCIIQ